MPKTFQLEIVTPERVQWSAECNSLRVPTLDGYVGILANHAPLVTVLSVGEIRVTQEDRCVRLAAAGGFMEVSQNKATILADTAERADEIDIPRAEAAERRARQRLDDRGKDVDGQRARAALFRALNRLRVARDENE